MRAPFHVSGKIVSRYDHWITKRFVDSVAKSSDTLARPAGYRSFYVTSGFPPFSESPSTVWPACLHTHRSVLVHFKAVCASYHFHPL